MNNIIITIEGGLIQNISGIPTGVKIIVKDFDDGDESHPSWDEQEGCFVNEYEAENE